MAIKIIMDSASDFPKHKAEKYDVKLVPLKISFDGVETFYDNVTMTHSEFYERLESSEEIPVTSMVTPTEFEDAVKDYVANGDSVIIITVSSKLSGCYSSAVITREEYENVYVIDSLSATIGESALGEYRAILAQTETDPKIVVEKVETAKKKLRVLAVLDTLKYLKKGGRISSAAAFAGGLLGIKPVITLDEGAIAVVGKARGSKAADNLIVKYVEDGNGIDESMPMFLGYTGSSRKLLDEYIENSKHIYSDVDKIDVMTIGCAIGTHVGPNAFGVAYFEK